MPQRDLALARGKSRQELRDVVVERELLRVDELQDPDRRELSRQGADRVASVGPRRLSARRRRSRSRFSRMISPVARDRDREAGHAFLVDDRGRDLVDASRELLPLSMAGFVGGGFDGVCPGVFAGRVLDGDLHEAATPGSGGSGCSGSRGATAATTTRGTSCTGVVLLRRKNRPTTKKSRIDCNRPTARASSRTDATGTRLCSHVDPHATLEASRTDIPPLVGPSLSRSGSASRRGVHAQAGKVGKARQDPARPAERAALADLERDLKALRPTRAAPGGQEARRPGHARTWALVRARSRIPTGRSADEAEIALGRALDPHVVRDLCERLGARVGRRVGDAARGRSVGPRRGPVRRARCCVARRRPVPELARTALWSIERQVRAKRITPALAGRPQSPRHAASESFVGTLARSAAGRGRRARGRAPGADAARSVRGPRSPPSPRWSERRSRALRRRRGRLRRSSEPGMPDALESRARRPVLSA